MEYFYDWKIREHLPRYGVQFDVYYDNHAAASAFMDIRLQEAFNADSNGKNEIEVTTTQSKPYGHYLTNKGLDAVLRSRMDENEEKRYDVHNTTCRKSGLSL